MRIHVYSDLHLEFAPCDFPEHVRSGELAELVLLAGDINVKRRGAAWAAATFSQPVLMIGGNHEAYGDSLYAAIAANREKAKACSDGRPRPVCFLERETWVSESAGGTPFRIIGTTLWSDFDLFGRSRQAEVMNVAVRESNDFRYIHILDDIYREKRRFDPTDALRLHREARSFLQNELNKHFDGVTIVMTHHAPSLKSVPPALADDLITAADASDLEGLIERTRPDLWVHGHIHMSSDYRIGATRVVCNPRGYHAFGLNPEFDRELVIEI